MFGNRCLCVAMLELFWMPISYANQFIWNSKHQFNKLASPVFKKTGGGSVLNWCFEYHLLVGISDWIPYVGWHKWLNTICWLAQVFEYHMLVGTSVWIPNVGWHKRLNTICWLLSFSLLFAWSYFVLLIFLFTTVISFIYVPASETN